MIDIIQIRLHYPKTVEQIENSYLRGSCDLDEVEQIFMNEHPGSEDISNRVIRNTVCKIIGLVREDLKNSVESYKDLENEWQQDDYAQRVRDLA